jgi:hypothetical protein
MYLTMYVLYAGKGDTTTIQETIIDRIGNTTLGSTGAEPTLRADLLDIMSGLHHLATTTNKRDHSSASYSTLNE